MSARSTEQASAHAPSALVWRMALNYLFFFGAIGAFWPYLGPHLRSLGLSGTQIGTLSALPPIAVALLAPAIGAFADRRAQHRRVLRLLLLPCALAVALLSQATGFAAVLALYIVWSASAAAIMPILDSYAITIGEAANTSYGRLRLFGTLGYMVAVMVVGWLLPMLPKGSFLLIYAGLLLMLVVTSGGLPASQTRAQAASPPMRIDLRAVLAQPALAAMLAVSFLTAVGMSTLGNFFGIHMSELGAGTALIGVANFIIALSEIPVMLSAGWLQRKFGNQRLIAIALGAYVLRYALYAAVPSAEWVLAIQLLHAPTYAIYLVASIRRVYDLAGRNQAATMQSVLAAAMAAGSVLGALLNGALADAFGVRAVFWLASLANVVALGVFLAASVRRRSDRNVPGLS